MLYCCSLMYHLCKSSVFCWNVSQIAYELWIRVFVSFSFKISSGWNINFSFYNSFPSNRIIICSKFSVIFNKIKESIFLSVYVISFNQVTQRYFNIQPKNIQKFFEILRSTEIGGVTWGRVHYIEMTQHVLIFWYLSWAP